jgi:hypothetical protein
MPADIGYVFYPSTRVHAPGYCRLEICIRPDPTERHFDPDKVRLPVLLAGDGIEALEIRHPWLFVTDYRICAGRVFITDRKHKGVEAFTFGGLLHIQSSEVMTTCVIESDAPLFHLDGFGSESEEEMVAVEAEVLLAARRAAHLYDPQEYDSHLCALSPLALYCACLTTLEAKFSRLHAHDEAHHQLLSFIRAEQKRLEDEGRWPLGEVRVEAVL